MVVVAAPRGERISMSYIVEATPGTMPAGNHAVLLCNSGDTLSYKRTNFTSARAEGDYQIADMRMGHGSVSGNIPCEPSYVNFDTIWAALLGGTAVVPAATVTGITIAAAAADQSFNDSANGLALFLTGTYIYVTGFVAANNNGFFKIKTGGVAGKIVVEGLARLTVEAEGPSVSIRGVQLVNGVVERTYTIQRLHPDMAAGKNAHYFGCVFDSAAFSMPVEGIATLGLGIIGMSADEAVAAVGTDAFTEYSPFDGISNTPQIDRTANTILQAFSFNVARNTGNIYTLGSTVTKEMIPKKLTITGQFTILEQGDDIWRGYLDNETELEIMLPCVDPDGNQQWFIFPRCKVTTIDNSDAEGIRVKQVSFQALKDLDRTDVTMAILSIVAP